MRRSSAPTRDRSIAGCRSARRRRRPSRSRACRTISSAFLDPTNVIRRHVTHVDALAAIRDDSTPRKTRDRRRRNRILYSRAGWRRRARAAVRRSVACSARAGSQLHPAEFLHAMAGTARCARAECVASRRRLSRAARARGGACAKPASAFPEPASTLRERGARLVSALPRYAASGDRSPYCDADGTNVGWLDLLDEAERVGEAGGRGKCGRLPAGTRVSARLEHDRRAARIAGASDAALRAPPARMVSRRDATLWCAPEAARAGTGKARMVYEARLICACPSPRCTARATIS